jgi:hypothetical protein
MLSSHLFKQAYNCFHKFPFQFFFIFLVSIEEEVNPPPPFYFEHRLRRTKAVTGAIPILTARTHRLLLSNNCMSNDWSESRPSQQDLSCDTETFVQSLPCALRRWSCTQWLVCGHQIHLNLCTFIVFVIDLTESFCAPCNCKFCKATVSID